MTQLLLITGTEIDGQLLSCSGAQLAVLIDSISAFTSQCIWYIGDVNTNTGHPEFTQAGANCIELATTQEIVGFVKAYEQFLSGVFIAVPYKHRKLLEGLTVSTEGPTHLYLEVSVVEIRTFDTSYFEVYTNSTEIFTTLRLRFGGSLHPVE